MNWIKPSNTGRGFVLLAAFAAGLALQSAHDVLGDDAPKPKRAKPAEFSTKVYLVPPSFLQHEQESGRMTTPRKVLENLGITFGPGSSARIVPVDGSLQLIVRNTAEQMELVEALFGQENHYPRQLTIIVEFIEVEQAVLTEWIFQNRLDSDGTPLRNMLQKRVRKGGARIVETAVVVGRSGQRFRTESVREFIYPTEGDPSEIPEKVKLADGSKAPMTVGNAAAFDVRNLGLTLEADPVLGPDGVTVDINLIPETVAEVGRSIWPNEELDVESRMEMPTFFANRISTSVTLIDGHYALLGTVDPLEPSLEDVEDPVLAVFVRVDVGSPHAAIAKEQEDRLRRGEKR